VKTSEKKVIFNEDLSPFRLDSNPRKNLTFTPFSDASVAKEDDDVCQPNKIMP
jgi:hypothetical protein